MSDKIATEIRKIGNSTGLILPKDLVTRLGLKNGDRITITEMPGGFRVSRSEAEFDRAMGIVDDVMNKYRNALEALAK